MAHASSVDSHNLPPQLSESGYNGQVTVNIRLLIDKTLARYSSDFVICRELIQNADDAGATWFHFDIVCSTTHDIHSQKDQSQRQQTTPILRGISNFFKNAKQSTQIHPSTEQNQTNKLASSELDFHNNYITEIRASNNGRSFDETDWERIISIAEGNTDVDSVGQFGVGFFSVFSLCEEPIIVSGNEYMSLIWDNDIPSVYYQKLPDEQKDQPTSIILTVSKEYVLLTDALKAPDSAAVSIQSKSNKKTNKIVPTMNLLELKKYLTKGKNKSVVMIPHSVSLLSTLIYKTY